MSVAKSFRPQAAGLILASSFLLAGGASHASLIFSDSFEGDTPGANPMNFGVAEPSETNVVIVDTEASDGLQSVFLSDDSATQNPNVSRDLGVNYSTSTLHFNFKEAAGSGAISFRVDMTNTGTGTKNFDLLLTGSNVVLRNPGGSTLISAALSAGNYQSGEWNAFDLLLSDGMDQARVWVNGTEVIDYSNAGINWGAGRFAMNMGFSSATGRSGYVDNVQFRSTLIPEPSSLALLLAGLGVLVRKCRGR